MQYYAVLDFHLPLKAGSVYGFMYACCIYSRNIEGCYSEFSYIEKVDLGCEKGKHVEIPFLFWIQLLVFLIFEIKYCLTEVLEQPGAGINVMAIRDQRHANVSQQRTL